MYSCFSLKHCCNVSLEAPPPQEEINISPDCVNLQLLKSGLEIINKKRGPDAQFVGFMPRAHFKTSSSTSGRWSWPDFGVPSEKALKPVDVRDVQPTRTRVELSVCSSSAPGRDESRASARAPSSLRPVQSERFRQIRCCRRMDDVTLGSGTFQDIYDVLAFT